MLLSFIRNTKEIRKGHSIKKLIIEANISSELKYKLNNYNFDVEIEGVELVSNIIFCFKLKCCDKISIVNYLKISMGVYEKFD